VIQRIQTVLLFLAFILNGSVFFNTLYNHAVNDPQDWIGIGFAIILTIAALGSLGAIFLYKNRQNHLRWVGRLLIPQVIAIGFAFGIYISLGGFGIFLLDETIGLGLLVLALISQLYARKKIKDDIELVKSMDRIR
jgi:peptidoglycan/LPS O-acetylase OafA/YrhL